MLGIVVVGVVRESRKFRAPIYRAHRAVIFATAQLSCKLFSVYKSIRDCIYTTKTFKFTYRLLSYTKSYSMAYSSDFVIIIFQTKRQCHKLAPDGHPGCTGHPACIRRFTVFTIYDYSTEFALLRLLTSSSRSTMTTRFTVGRYLITVAAYT